MTALERTRRHRQEILEIAHRHGAKNLRVSGSTIRGEEGPDSDIDLLIDTTDAIQCQVLREAQPL